MVVAYAQDAKVLKLVRIVVATAFLEPNKIEKVLDMLREWKWDDDVADVEAIRKFHVSFLNYFEDTWIRYCSEIILPFILHDFLLKGQLSSRVVEPSQQKPQDY